MFQNRFDEFYLTICKEVGGIEGLLKSFFDFLFRKTDFFYECDPGDKMGFPPGYSENMLMGIYQKFQEQHYKRFPKKDHSDFEQKMKKFKQLKEKTKQKSEKNPSQVKLVQKIQQPKIKVESKPKQEQKKKAIEQMKKVEPIINTYNGGKNDNYSWSQQSNDVEVTVSVEDGLNKKMINVSIKNTSISITKKTGEIIVEGQLYQKINASQSYWKIEKSGSKTLIIMNLEKAQDKIWSTVFKGDAEIDTSKVNNTKPLNDFDPETQGAIRKIMYQQQRKQMGLPTTEEQKQTQALKQAWDAEGSPFKGQPFDPSKFNLQGSEFKPQ